MKSPETVQTHQDGLQHGRKNRLQDMKQSDQASMAISMMVQHSMARGAARIAHRMAARTCAGGAAQLGTRHATHVLGAHVAVY